MRPFIRMAITCIALSAWSGCDAQNPPPPNASVPDLSAESSQVLITFERNTPPERIAKVTRDLGVRIDQTMFDRIVVGSSAGNRSMADLQTAAKKYPEVVAVEPSQKVKAQ
jgi:hypothetical protein